MRMLRNLRVPDFLIRMILIWYASDTRLIRIWYSFDTHLIRIWYSSDTYLILIWYASDTHLILIWYSSDTHLILIWYSDWVSDTGASIRWVSDWYSWYSFDTHRAVCWWSVKGCANPIKRPCIASENKISVTLKYGMSILFEWKAYVRKQQMEPTWVCCCWEQWRHLNTTRY